jgi:hypothetical protein
MKHWAALLQPLKVLPMTLTDDLTAGCAENTKRRAGLLTPSDFEQDAR